MTLGDTGGNLASNELGPWKYRFLDRPSDGDLITSYNILHFVTYLRLLDAEAAGVDWRDPDRCDRARSIYDAHLARARWMTEKGYRELLER